MNYCVHWQCTLHVYYTCTLHRWENWQRTLHMNGAPICALTVYNACALHGPLVNPLIVYTVQAVYFVHIHCLSVVRCEPFLPRGSAKSAAGSRGASVKCATSAWRATSVYCCAKHLLTCSTICRIFQESCNCFTQYSGNGKLLCWKFFPQRDVTYRPLTTDALFRDNCEGRCFIYLTTASPSPGPTQDLFRLFSFFSPHLCHDCSLIYDFTNAYSCDLILYRFLNSSMYMILYNLRLGKIFQRHAKRSKFLHFHEIQSFTGTRRQLSHFLSMRTRACEFYLVN